MEGRVWLALSDELAQNKVDIITQARLDAITNEGVIIVDQESHKILLKVDTIVLACGMTPVNFLAAELEGKVNELYIIGDAKQPRTIRNAISEGYTLAYHL